VALRTRRGAATAARSARTACTRSVGLRRRGIRRRAARPPAGRPAGVSGSGGARPPPGPGRSTWGSRRRGSAAGAHRRPVPGPALPEAVSGGWRSARAHRTLMRRPPDAGSAGLDQTCRFSGGAPLRERRVGEDAVELGRGARPAGARREVWASQASTRAGPGQSPSRRGRCRPGCGWGPAGQPHRRRWRPTRRAAPGARRPAPRRRRPEASTSSVRWPMRPKAGSRRWRPAGGRRTATSAAAAALSDVLMATAASRSVGPRPL
jgi:hypothetical protein